MTALVAKGDKTTTRGEVLSGSSSQYDEEGRTLAVDLDWASCGECSGGPFRIFGSVEDWMDDGRKMVKDLDLVHCPCRKNRVLAKRQDYLIEQGGSGRPVRTSTSNTEVRTVQSYDEQIRIVDDMGHPAANCPFHITDSAGRTYQGLTDDDGLCPRVYTSGQKTLDIAVGFKALERWEQ